MAKLTDEEKAARRQAKKEFEARRREEEKQDEALILATLRSILQDDRATPTEKIFAICALDSIKYYHIVPDMAFLKDEPDVLARLRERYKTELAGDQASSTT